MTVTNQADEWAPDFAHGPKTVDLDRACPARMNDYYLDGHYNFAIDRKQARLALAVLPELRTAARQNRAFVRRAVQYAARRGVRQFLDLGSGLLGAGSVHAVAQRIAPDCRTIYTDNEPVSVAHNDKVLEANPCAMCFAADITRPEQVLEHAAVQHLLDLHRPVLVLLCDVLSFVPDEQRPRAVVDAYRTALAPGSYLAFSHLTDADYPEQMGQVAKLYERTQDHLYPRSRPEIGSMLAGFDHLAPPGITYASLWRPVSIEDIGNPIESLNFVALGAVA
ncbi:SAM-dependent methyltransferase [Kutzneria sp. NPDC051319]|uniref:SAM-dependent methyltransferase n=1 Tax=Kutzneria sp. NPDC051319 TaxID=3155047 RepID=UPI003426DC7B